jgi:hypothetical protein
MKIIEDKISIEELKKMAEEFSGDFVKAVVDTEREILAVNAEMHSDLEAELLNDGSMQYDLWGINLYPGKSRNEWIEFDSLINIRPKMNNRSTDVEDNETRSKIINIVESFIK